MKRLMPALLVCTLVTALAPAPAAFADEADPFTCPATPAPVVALDHGSRYVAEDDSRSRFDETSNDDVNAQLKPVDTFISDLVGIANQAISTPADRAAAADCVRSALAVWAEADALSDLATMNAQLSAPSRIGGLAFAYAQIRPFLPNSDDTALVEGWFADRARATMDYFDNDAPPKASQNNLRAWAGLAVARIGLTVEDPAMIDWADATVRLVACQAAPDGSLPLEMARQELALHYQLHAVGPLVVTASLLQARGHDLFEACDGAVRRAVNFVVAAFADPSLVETVAGHPQTYFDGSDELAGFELAWSTAYLSLFNDPRLQKLVSEYGALSNSKLGGRQSLLWGQTKGPTVLSESFVRGSRACVTGSDVTAEGGEPLEAMACTP